MVKISGVVADLVENKTFNIDVMEHDFSLTLDKDEVYSIGVDQSTSNTGVFIKDHSGKTAIILELTNCGEVRFSLAIKRILKGIVRGMRIKNLIFERPLDYISGRSNGKLLELKKDLMNIKNEIPELFDVNLRFELPQNWRAGFIPRDTTFSRRSKDTVVHYVLKRYPMFADFTYRCGTDRDGFEACGILLGYFARRQLDENGDGYELIIGQANTKKKAFAFYKYFDETFGGDWELFQGVFGKGKIKMYNDEHTFPVNVKMSLEDDLSMFIPDEMTKLQLSNLNNLSYNPDKDLVVLVAPKKEVQESFAQYLFEHDYLVEVI